MKASQLTRTITVVLLALLVAAPAAATPVEDAPGTQRPHPGTSSYPGTIQADEQCGTVEGLTVSDVTLSVDIENGTAHDLEVEGETTTVSLRNGSILLDDARLFVERATIGEDGLRPESGAITIVSGSFFLHNGTATVDGEQVSLENRQFTIEADAASASGVTVSGVDRVSRAPASLLENSTMDALTLFDLSNDLRFDSASREVLGVVRLRMDDVEVSERPLQPTFEDVTVEDGELKATSVSVPVEDGDLSIGELAVTSGSVTTRTTDVDADLEDETAEFDDVTLERAHASELLDGAC